MGTKKNGLELYLHIPFCIKKCDYCDFLSGPSTRAGQEAYIYALLREMETVSKNLKKRPVDTVFIGGGTPSVPECDVMEKLLQGLRDYFLFSADAEVTIEANPGTLTPEKLSIYRKYGINRISIGLQSPNNKELAMLGRIHNYAQFLESFQMAREAGFSNINVDLMIAILFQNYSNIFIHAVLRIFIRQIQLFSGKRGALFNNKTVCRNVLRAKCRHHPKVLYPTFITLSRNGKHQIHIYMEEPIVNAEIMVTTEFIGAIMDLCQERRGQYLGMEYMEETRALLKYKLPLNEIIYDFFDALKSRSRGYASLDYELCGYERSELVKLDILVNKEEVDALSFIVHADTSYERGRKMCEKLKDEIPRQLFEIPIQAAIGSKIIARETVKAMRKDVLAKCYGGDISRKKKLLEKQKEGKKRMRQVGNVEIPQKAFMSVLKLDEN